MTHIRVWLLRLILLLWGVQVIYLAWHFQPEVVDLAVRLFQGKVGAAVRQEDPLYCWSLALAPLIPENATYVFLDNYEAGKEIEMRYFLAPRRHLLLAPEVPASFLFYTMHRERASYLILRDREQPLGPGVQAARQSPAVQAVAVPGPGLVFRVDPGPLQWGFYD